MMDRKAPPLFHAYIGKGTYLQQFIKFEYIFNKTEWTSSLFQALTEVAYNLKRETKVTQA
jgi:hypothetical protein